MVKIEEALAALRAGYQVQDSDGDLWFLDKDGSIISREWNGRSHDKTKFFAVDSDCLKDSGFLILPKKIVRFPVIIKCKKFEFYDTYSTLFENIEEAKEYIEKYDKNIECCRLLTEVPELIREEERIWGNLKHENG